MARAHQLQQSSRTLDTPTPRYPEEGMVRPPDRGLLVAMILLWSGIILGLVVGAWAVATTWVPVA